MPSGSIRHHGRVWTLSNCEEKQTQMIKLYPDGTKQRTADFDWCVERDESKTKLIKDEIAPAR